MIQRRSKWIRSAACVLALTMAVMFTGCRDEVRTETTIEIHRESPPEMVSPGEMIVE